MSEPNPVLFALPVIVFVVLVAISLLCCCYRSKRMGRVYGNQFPRGVDNHIMIHSIDPSHSVNQAKDSVPPKKNRKGGGKSGGGGGDSKGSSQIVIIVDHENNNSSIQNCDNNTGVSNNNDCPRTSNTDDAPRTSNNDNIPSTTNESVDRYYSSDIPTTAFLTPHQSSVTHSSPSQDTSSYYTSNRHKSYPNDLPSYNDPSPNHHSSSYSYSSPSNDNSSSSNNYTSSSNDYSSSSNNYTSSSNDYSSY